jgi:hypothetical protein
LYAGRHTSKKQGSHGHVTRTHPREDHCAGGEDRRSSHPEREIWALEKLPARKPGPKPRRKPEASNQAEARQSIGSAIADVLGRQGALSAAELAEHIRATGRDISNRTVSFSLQSLKKRGLAKSADGKWALTKADSRQVRS